MEMGQEIFFICRLVLGAMASFLAIMLWSRTRDAAWIFIIIGTIIAYIDTIFSILNLLGIGGGNILTGKSLFFESILITCLPTVSFIAALMIMVIRKYRYR
jgi:hypothetical protein